MLWKECSPMGERLRLALEAFDFPRLREKRDKGEKAIR
jgi:hypothetical protein